MALQWGDTVSLKITLPDSSVLAEHSVTTNRFKAQQFVFTGKRRPAGGWPQGEYTGSYEVMRNGEVVDSATKTIRLVE